VTVLSVLRLVMHRCNQEHAVQSLPPLRTLLRPASAMRAGRQARCVTAAQAWSDDDSARPVGWSSFAENTNTAVEPSDPVSSRDGLIEPSAVRAFANVPDPVDRLRRLPGGGDAAAPAGVSNVVRDPIADLELDALSLLSWIASDPLCLRRIPVDTQLVCYGCHLSMFHVVRCDYVERGRTAYCTTHAHACFG